MSSTSIKNIGIISTRIAGTDGVSLEISKWVDIFKRNNYNCFYFSGESDREDSISYQIEEAHFAHPEIRAISSRVFGNQTRSQDISEKIEITTGKLKKSLYDFYNKYKLDLIIPENALTIPMNIPLGLAITEFIAETGIPTIAHHHDFYWERERFIINSCQDYLNKAFPADLPSIRHVTINSIGSFQLSLRRGCSNTIVPNVYNFAEQPQQPDLKAINELKNTIGLKQNELFILQPTRIVPRKWIERAVEIVYNMKLNNPKLIISHESGDEGDEYFKNILEYSKNLGIQIITIDELITHEKSDNKKYSLIDLYQSADLITYPSGYEGFGNAFLETVYYYKPIVVNRYSVFIADIEPKGFDVITMDGVVSKTVIENIYKILENKERLLSMVEQNYQLAKKYFSYEMLEKKLMHIISTFD